MSDENNKLSKAVDDHPLSTNRDPNKKEWVKFEEENDRSDVPNSELKVNFSRNISRFSDDSPARNHGWSLNHLWPSRIPRHHPKTNQPCWTRSRFMWQSTSRQKHWIQVRMEKIHQKVPERVSQSTHHWDNQVRRCGMLNSKKPSNLDSVVKNRSNAISVTDLFVFSKWRNYCIVASSQCQSALDYTGSFSTSPSAWRTHGSRLNCEFS